MRVLLIGGTGVISSGTAAECLKREMDLTLLNRGLRQEFLLSRTELLKSDYGDAEVVKTLLKGKHFDSVVDFRCEIPFAEGSKRMVSYFDADPARAVPDSEWDAEMDSILARYQKR